MFTLLTKELDRVELFLNSDPSKHNKHLSQISLSVENIVQDYRKIREQLEHLFTQSNDNNTQGVFSLLESIYAFVSKPVDLKIWNIPFQRDFFELIFYLEVAIKVRDVLEIYGVVEDSFLETGEDWQEWKMW